MTTSIRLHSSIHTLLVLLLGILCTSIATACIDEEDYPDTPRGNVEALWKIIDEHYCFLDYKQQEYGLDWNAIRQEYLQQADGIQTQDQLFELLSGMLSELRDGHVNLYAAHNQARYWAWYEDYPTNYSDSLQRLYLRTDYYIASGLKYRILDDNIGYLRYESFAYGVGESSLDEALSRLAACRALIVDIRENGGGQLTNASKLAARFCQQRTLVGYTQHKTGTGHSDFSAMSPIWLEPSARMRWHKRVALLTNRHVFSAANEFTMYMKELPLVTIVGDHTGGGAGMPFSSSLPNGWSVRFSAVPTYDARMQSIEFGIEPDHNVSLDIYDFFRGKDTLIEFARKLLVQ